jgi:hypothetical protein
MAISHEIRRKVFPRSVCRDVYRDSSLAQILLGDQLDRYEKALRCQAVPKVLFHFARTVRRRDG